MICSDFSIVLSMYSLDSITVVPCDDCVIAYIKFWCRCWSFIISLFFVTGLVKMTAMSSPAHLARMVFFSRVGQSQFCIIQCVWKRVFSITLLGAIPTVTLSDILTFFVMKSGEDEEERKTLMKSRASVSRFHQSYPLLLVPYLRWGSGVTNLELDVLSGQSENCLHSFLCSFPFSCSFAPCLASEGVGRGLTGGLPAQEFIKAPACDFWLVEPVLIF